MHVHKATRVSIGKAAFDQIGHVLLNYDHKSALLKLRPFREATIDSGHFLVVRCRVVDYSWQEHKVRNKFDLTLKDVQGKESYQEAIRV